MQSKKESVKMDQILKSLFSVSKGVLIKLMNGLFHESFKEEETEISIGNNEFVSEEFNIIRGDLFLELTKNKKMHQYHIEFQTKNDKTMIIRMFEYGFNRAKELSRYEEEKILYIPKQLVIFIEENNNIKDELKMKIIFPNQQEINYVVPVMKYWKYTDKELLENKMYPLLPLQIFKLRSKLEKIKENNVENKNKELYRLLNEAKEIAIDIAKKSRELFDKGEIVGEDLHKILLAIQNLIEYLNERYGEYEEIEKEVISVTKTLYDPLVAKNTAKEIAKNLILANIDEAIIIKTTGVTKKEIIKLKEELKQ